MKNVNKLETIKTYECSCDICKSMCMRPCWGTPEEMNKIIKAGFADRLMLDYYYGDGDGEINYVLSPALKGYERHQAPFIPMSSKGCTFWKRGKCELHELGLKPVEGRAAHHSLIGSEQGAQVRELLAEAWKSNWGEINIELWQTYTQKKENSKQKMKRLLKITKEMTHEITTSRKNGSSESQDKRREDKRTDSPGSEQG